MARYAVLVPAAFAVVNTQQSALGHMVDYGPFSLCVIHKEGLCPSFGDNNRLIDGRFGVVVRILAYYAIGREFNFRTVQHFCA
jgi:hypothetical protein